MERRAEIDGLRAVAVLPIILFHAGIPGLPGGFVGVDIFYVISGFLITGLIAPTADTRRFSFLAFYERRIRRLFPALFVMLAVVAVAGATILMPFDFEAFGRSAVATLLFISNLFFWRNTGYFAPESHVLPLLHTWSLGIEEQFYILYPTALILAGRLFRGKLAWPVAWATVASFGLSVWCVGYRPDAAFYLLPFRAWELLLGALVFLAQVNWRSDRVRRGAGALGGILLVANMVLLTPGAPFPGLGALPACLGTAILISTRGAPVERFLTAPLVRGVGLISYSLYLWHWPIIALCHYRIGHELSFGPSVAAVALIFVVAYLSWRFVEEPVRRGQILVSRSRLFGVGAGVLVVLLCATASVFLTSGVPGRFDPEVGRINSASRDSNGACAFVATDGQTLRNMCHLGAPGRPSILLWGDSYAWSQRRIFDRAFAANGQSGALASRGGCPPAVGINVDGWPVCAALTRAVMTMIRKERIPIVVMVANWSGYEHHRLSSKTQGGSPREILTNALERTLAGLRSEGVQVIMVDPAPGARDDVPRFLAQKAAYGLRKNLAFSFTDYLAENSIYYTFVAKHPDLARVHLANAYCHTETCVITEAGKPLYFDSHHVAWSSLFAVPQVRADLAAVPPTGLARP